jgi:hypothetical protein
MHGHARHLHPSGTKEARGAPRPLSGEIEFEHGLVALDTFRVSLAYWKVWVARTARGRFAVAAFLVSQAELMKRELPVPEGVCSASMAARIPGAASPWSECR